MRDQFQKNTIVLFLQVPAEKIPASILRQIAQIHPRRAPQSPLCNERGPFRQASAVVPLARRGQIGEKLPLVRYSHSIVKIYSLVYIVISRLQNRVFFHIFYVYFLVSFVLGVKVWSRKNVKAATFCMRIIIAFICTTYISPDTSFIVRRQTYAGRVFESRLPVKQKFRDSMASSFFGDFFGKKRNLSIVCPLRLISRQSNPVCIISDNLNSYQNGCKIKPVLRDNLTVGLQIKVEPVI